MEYIILTLSSVLLAGSFSMNKLYQKEKGASPLTGLGYTALVAVFSSIIFFVINGFKISFTPFSFIMIILGNLLTTAYTVIGFKILSTGTMALYTLFLMAGGMTVPYIWGLLFLGEPFSFMITIALILILAGIILSNKSDGKSNRQQLFLCIAVFVLNGFVSVCSKIHQIETNYEILNTTEYSLLAGLTKIVMAGLLYYFIRKKTEKAEGQASSKLAPRTIFKLILITACVAVFGGVSSVILLWGASNFPASVLYPFTTGGTIIFSTLAGKIFFHDKLSKRMIISVLLCFIGSVLFL